MSIVRDLVQTTDGFLVLAENANPSHEYVCPTCAQKLNSRTMHDNRYFSHLRGESQACRLAIPKTNYHRVLTKCQNRDNWRLHVECATPACKQEVEGPYHVSREGAYRIIVRALRTHEYHVKAGCARFQIRAVFCDACKASTGTAVPVSVPVSVPTTITDAESVAAQATTTQRAAALSKNAAHDQHAAALGQLVVAEREEKIAFEQHQIAVQRRLAAQTLETTSREQSRSASKILAAATTTEQVAMANVTRIRERNEAENATARERERVTIRMEALAQVEAHMDNHQGGTNTTTILDLVNLWERLEATIVATREEDRVAAKSVEGTQNAPVEIKDLERPNVADELRAAIGALNAYVDTFKFNLSGTHPDLRVWVTRGTTSGPPQVLFPRMTTLFGVRSAAGFETNPRVHKNLDLNLANPLIAELVTGTETRLLACVLANRVSVFGHEMTDRGVKAMFRPMIHPLPVHFRCEAYSKYVRIKVAPTQHVKLYTGEGTSTRVTVGVSDIRPGDDVVVTVKLVPYFSSAYFGVLCVCTHAILYRHELKNWEGQTHVEEETATLEREAIEATTRLRVQTDRENLSRANAVSEARERERVEAEARERVEAEREEARKQQERVEAENTRRERLAIEATKKRVEAENARLQAGLLVSLEQEVRAQMDAERAERTRLRVQTEREEREAAEAAVGERVRAAAEAQNAERLQAAIDATKASLFSDSDWKMPPVRTPEEPCYACNGSGTSYWCDGDYGSCLECCCIRCTRLNSKCNCTKNSGE